MTRVDADAATAARWAKAARLADQVTDHGMGAAVRAYYLFYWPAGAVLLTAVGFLSSVLMFEDATTRWQLHLGIALALTAVGTLFGALVYSSKKVSPRVRPQRSAALIWLDTSEQKLVLRQIRGRIPPIAEQLPVARGAAVQMRLGLAQQILQAPTFVLLLAGQMLMSPNAYWYLFWVPLMLLFIGVAIATIRQFRQTGRFLTRTAAGNAVGQPPG